MWNSRTAPYALVGRRAPTAALTALAVLAALAGCGGNGGGGAPDAAAFTAARFAVTKVSLEAPGANCASGGSRIESGIDANNNAVLDTAEVSGVQYACHGAPGSAGSAGATGAGGGSGSAGTTSLVRVDAEPAGAHCAAGGAKISAGIDTSGNGVLDAGEVGSTSYVCAGSDGTNGVNGSNGANGSNGSNGLASLTAIVSEPIGANCSYGGKKVTSGLDANANNVLDAGEVSATDYLCNGTPSAGLNWVNVTGTSQAMVANAGYLANHASAQVTLTLPASPSLGEAVSVTGVGFGGWKIAQNAGQSISARSLSNDLPAGAVWRTSGPAGDWTGIASSADGLRLVAGLWNGPLYSSSDGGASWTARESVRAWRSVASSAAGNKLVAVVFSGQIYTSTDSGANWTARDSARNWFSVASSSDGSKLIASVYGGQLYTSADSGVTWTARESNRNWRGVATSADGTKLVALVIFGQAYTSSDAGASWTARDSNREWEAVASSADGSRLIAVVRGGGQVQTSADAGLTWTARVADSGWRSVASSADGGRLCAGSAVGQVRCSVSGRSTSGVTGFVSGGQYDALTLQYLGNGEWAAGDHALTSPLHME